MMLPALPALRMNGQWSSGQPVSQSWRSFRCATSRSPYMTSMGGSCALQYLVGRRDVRHQLESSASFRRKPNITPTCMMMPTCPTCSASLGCIRMPYDFAERLFDSTRLGMRVIVAPTDVVPVGIDHPALFQPKTGPDNVAASTAAAQASEAARKADQARLVAVTASREAARVMMAIRTAEYLKLKAEEQLAKANEQAEDVKAKVAATQVDKLASQLASAKAELQPKLDAAAAARESAVAAEAARVVAAETARKMARDFDPVSVFISRKTQHLYVRQAFQPILDIPVTIEDVDRPIGTHIFT